MMTAVTPPGDGGDTEQVTSVRRAAASGVHEALELAFGRR
jgi:hypothetical protein